jgi:hypothetical protein
VRSEEYCAEEPREIEEDPRELKLRRRKEKRTRNASGGERTVKGRPFLFPMSEKTPAAIASKRSSRQRNHSGPGAPPAESHEG